MTERLFLDEPRYRRVTAKVVAAAPEAVVLDRTIFYARSGGQPGDTGHLLWEGGETAIADTLKGPDDAILHVPDVAAVLPAPGATVEAVLDWPRRWAFMRMHTALHLLCATLPDVAVTGGQIGADRSRLDFVLPNPPAKEPIEERLNELMAADYPVTTEWVDESVLDTSPELVRTLSVKPPRGTGRLRLVRIGEGAATVDLQPCGGTHVAHTGEIGPLTVAKIENKGRHNRRIVIAWAEANHG